MLQKNRKKRRKHQSQRLHQQEPKYQRVITPCVHSVMLPPGNKERMYLRTEGKGYLVKSQHIAVE